MRAHVLAALRAELPDLPDEVAARVEVTPAREAAHGDMATNAAMVSARHAGRKPAELAGRVAHRLTEAGVAQAEVAGPGFVNLRLPPEMLRAQLPVDPCRAAKSYGDSTVGARVAVNVEYVSANPTGPMHIGHCRGAVVGDALSNLLAKAGFDVTKEYYINDAGAQVAALAWAAYWRYLQAIGTALTEDDFSAIVPGGLQYRGDYLVPVGNTLGAEHGRSLAESDATPAAPSVWLDVVRETTIGKMMESIREDLAALGVVPDVFTSERALLEGGAVDRAIEVLRAKNLIYEGVLEPPKGKTPEDWEPRPQTLFRATQFGDDVDRPLKKSDGSNTYFANDIAYHADKVARGARVMIDVWGADHGGYVSRMKAAVRAVADAWRDAGYRAVPDRARAARRRAGADEQARRQFRDLARPDRRGRPRRGALHHADAQVGCADGVRPGPGGGADARKPGFLCAVRPCHAAAPSCGWPRPSWERTRSRRTSLAEVKLETLTAEPELALIRRLIAWPRTVEGAALAREPHRIAFFLYDLAADFHMLWNRGRDDAALRFLVEGQPAETLARLALVQATATVIRSGLAVLGVAPVEEMR